MIFILAFVFGAVVVARKFTDWFLLFLILFLGVFLWQIYKFEGKDFLKRPQLDILSKKLLNFLLYPPKIFLLLKASFVVISAFFVGTIVVLAIYTTWVHHRILYDAKEFISYKPYGVKKYTREWQKIKRRLDFDIEAEWKLAVLESFELLTKALQAIGWRGKDFEELSKILTKEEISNLEELIQLYRIREDIVADPALKLEKQDAEKVVKAVEQALTEIHCL